MKVLVVDDHPAMREALKAVVRKAFDDVTVYCESTLEAAIATTGRSNSFDLALLDLRLPGCTGIEALTRFRDRFPRVPTVVVSGRDDRASIVPSLKAGAAGYIPKASTQKVMVAALQLVTADSTYLPPQVLAYVDVTPAKNRENRGGNALGLTERQREVLRLLLRGYSNSRIATELHIVEGTVKQHAHAIYDALGVSTRGQLFAFAARGAIRRDGSSVTKVV